MKLRKLFSFILIVSLTILLVNGWFSHLRKLREDHLVRSLIKVGEAYQGYQQKNGQYIQGSFSTEETNKFLGINLSRKDIYVFFEKKEHRPNKIDFEFTRDNNGKWVIFASVYKSGETAFLRDAFVIAIDEGPIDRNASSPNPCCVDDGLCPTLGQCVLGK